MRLWIRRLLVVLLALAFVGGGVGRAALVVAADEPCHPSAQQHAGESAGHAHAAHDEHAAHHHADAGDTKNSGTSNACFKCCGLCTVVPNLTARAPVQTAFVAVAISYLVSVENFTDRPIVLDPGIPKRIA